MSNLLIFDEVCFVVRPFHSLEAFTSRNGTLNIYIRGRESVIFIPSLSLEICYLELTFAKNAGDIIFIVRPLVV